MDGSYLRQAELVVRCIPAIAAEPCFAIKGGTAINLFELNLPRLSVDIDLTFLKIAGREESIAEINGSLERVARELKRRGIAATLSGAANARKLYCSADRVATFEQQFAGMADEPFSYDEHKATLARLAKDVLALFDGEDRRRLLDFVSLSDGPGAFGIPNFDDLPAIRWKRRNLELLKKSNPARFAQQRDALEQLW